MAKYWAAVRWHWRIHRNIIANAEYSLENIKQHEPFPKALVMKYFLQKLMKGEFLFLEKIYKGNKFIVF